MPRFVSSIPMAAAILAVSSYSLAAQAETRLYDHVHMSVPDPQAAAQWYHDHVGGEFVDGRDGPIRFFYVAGPDGARVELVQRASDMRYGQRVSLQPREED